MYYSKYKDIDKYVQPIASNGVASFEIVIVSICR